MTVDYAKLALIAHGNGKKMYYYDATTDTMATVSAAGFFNNLTGAQRITVDDVIFCQCSDGDVWLRAAVVNDSTGTSSAGVVYTSVVGGVGDGPWNGVIGTASLATLVPGIYEIGTGTASAHSIAAPPRIGDVITLIQTGTATGGVTVVTSSAGVTIDAAGDRTVTFNAKGQSITLKAVSATRYVILQSNVASYA